MKKLPLIISIIALLGVVVLAIVSVVSKPGNQQKSTTASSPSDGIKIAYINTDSVLLNYQLAADLNTKFVSQQQQYHSEFSKKQQQFQRDATAFQEKVQRGGFLSEERAIKERDKILGQEQEIKQMDYELSTRLAGLEQQINKQLVDSIVSYVKEYNIKNNYTFILSNSGSIIVGEQKYNISKEILDGLNARYLKSKK